MSEQWPPHPFNIALKDMDTWAAWYSGDTDRLADIYGTPGYRRRARYSPDGNLAGNGDTYFWGRPNPQNAKRRHVPIAADLARASSDLLFSKPPVITLGDQDKQNEPLMERLSTMFGPDTFSAVLSEAGEHASVFGGVYFRPWWDSDIADHIVPHYVTAAAAIPEFRHNVLTAVTFWQELPQEPGSDYANRTVRHLERHEPGRIIHTVWAGDSSHLGEKIGIADIPETEWLAESLEDGVDNTEVVQETGLDRLDVVYIANVRPNRGWANEPKLANLGRSDFEGIESEFDALDETASGMITDVRNGKGRIFVEEQYLRDDGPGSGASFDEDQGVYVKLATGLGSATSGGSGIDAVQLQIRWREYAQVYAEILAVILQNAGLSAQNFNDGRLTTGVTATEVDARNAVGEATRKKKINYWRAGLTEFVKIVMELDAIHFETGLHLTQPPVVRFPSQATQSDSELAQTIATKRSAGIISVAQAVQQVNPDWTSEEVDEELDRIAEDKVAETKLAFGKGLDEGDNPDAEPTEGMEPSEAFTGIDEQPAEGAWEAQQEGETPAGDDSEPEPVDVEDAGDDG